MPDEFEQVFREIDTLVLETDLDLLSNSETQAMLRNSLLYSNGSSLKSVLKPKTYQALKSYCRTKGLSIEAMAGMKPSLVAITLIVTEMSRLGLAGTGVDQIFLNKAKSAGKKITGLESAKTQFNVLETMGKNQEDELILATLKDLKNTKNNTDGMKKAWRTGDMAEMEKISIKNLEANLPEFNKSLLTDRNNDWIPKIKAMLSTPEREWVLVGALHLAGKDGILAILKKQGYLVEYY